MTNLTLIAGLLLLSAFVQAAAGQDLVVEYQREGLSLNGRWECLLEHADAEVWRPEVAAGLEGWRRTLIPGTLLPGVPRKEHQTVGCVWGRKTFSVSAAQAARNAVLKWHGIRHGATVWLNGREIGRHPTIGPHTMLLPPGALRRGENVLVLKVPGWAGIPKGEVGYPLIPTGSGTQSWGSKQAGIYDDIYLEFYDRAYLKWILAVPDIAAKAVTFRIWPDGAGKLPGELELEVRVRPETSEKLAGQAAATVSTGRSPVEVAVQLEEVRPWTPATPHVYVAELTARAAGKPCDKVRVHFGMRQIAVRDGRYRLNDRRLRFRGSNLVCEWLWGGREGRFYNHAKQYIVDEARVMNLNSFRTHTLPPAGLWADVCDRHGTMILAELPVLYNHRDFKFTPAELKLFHANALLDATGWVTKLWNHPSIVIWVLSNESRRDTPWESGPYWKHVRGLDPTRPCLKTGDMAGTPETTDMHTCGNYGDSLEGQVLKRFAESAARKDPKRTLTNTEYMNIFRPRESYSLQWLGRKDHAAEARNFAEFAMEHTEAMRRHDFDGIFPYMYAGWTRLRGNNWRADYPTPMAAALHSCMAPVLASLDLFDRNFVAGSEVATELALINDMHEDAAVQLEICLTPKDPLFVPTAASLKAAVDRQSFDLTFKACSTAPKTIRWKVPAAEGVYYLAAVVRRAGDRPAVSQRVVRSIQKPSAGKGKPGRVIVLGANEEVQKCLNRYQVPHSMGLKKGKIDADTVLIWSDRSVSKADRSAAPAILEFARAGGRLVIAGHSSWSWKELVDFRVGRGSFSRAFGYPQVRHRLLAGVDPEWLKRWNGQLGAVTTGVISGEILERGEKLLWAGAPARTVALRLPVGRGEIVIALLQLRGRLDPLGKTYDPAADRMFRNLLGL